MGKTAATALVHALASTTEKRDMADLRIENPKTTEGFVEMLAVLNVKLPVSVSGEDVGVVLDADGNDVLTVDVNAARSDEQANGIAVMIMLAINTCGGFKAVRS